MLKRFDPLQIGEVRPKKGRNFGVFWAGDPLKVNFKAPNPLIQKARVRNRTRRLSYQACESVKNCDL